MENLIKKLMDDRSVSRYDKYDLLTNWETRLNEELQCGIKTANEVRYAALLLRLIGGAKDRLYS